MTLYLKEIIIISNVLRTSVFSLSRETAVVTAVFLFAGKCVFRLDKQEEAK